MMMREMEVDLQFIEGDEIEPSKEWKDVGDEEKRVSRRARGDASVAFNFGSSEPQLHARGTALPSSSYSSCAIYRSMSVIYFAWQSKMHRAII